MGGCPDVRWVVTHCDFRTFNVMSMADSPDLSASDDRGAEATFSRLFAELYPELLRYAVRRLDPEDAADAVAEAFLAAWRRRADVHPGASRSWLFRATINAIQNEERARFRRGRLQVKLAALPEEQVTWQSARLSPAELEAVHRALAALGPNDRELLRLVAWDHLSVSDAAGILGCSAGTTRVRLHRARRRFAEALESLLAQPTIER